MPDEQLRQIIDRMDSATKSRDFNHSFIIMILWLIFLAQCNATHGQTLVIGQSEPLAPRSPAIILGDSIEAVEQKDGSIVIKSKAAPSLGVATTITSTNRLAPTFEPVGCQYCERVHHWRVIEQFAIVQSNVVPAMIQGRLHHIPVSPPLTNSIGLYTTNYIEHPALYRLPYQREMPFPPLPPDPRAIYLQHRSRVQQTAVPPTAP